MGELLDVRLLPPLRRGVPELMARREEAPRAGLPHSEESERAVLACVLLHPGLAPQLLDELQPEAFFLERHQMIYRAYAALSGAEKPIDLRTVQEVLETAGHFEVVGGHAYMAGLDLDLPAIDRFEHYCAIVRERYAKRRLVLYAETLRSAAMNGAPAAEIVAEAEAELASIEENQLAAAPAAKIGDLVLDFEPQTNAGHGGISSGIVDLDKVTGGWHPGQLITVAGATGMGKTALALGFAIAAAKAGVPTLLISLEMTEKEVTARFMSQLSQIPHESVFAGRVPSSQLSSVANVVRISQDLPLWMTEKTPQSAQSIGATARQWKLRHGLGLLVVDYLQLVTHVGAKMERRFQIGEMTRSFKLLAKQLSATVIQLSQIKRTEDREPTIRDAKESGEIENDSNKMIMPYRAAYYDNRLPYDDPKQGKASLIVGKNREGKTGHVKVAWIGETMTFRDRANQEEPEGGYREWAHR